MNPLKEDFFIEDAYVLADYKRIKEEDHWAAICREIRRQEEEDNRKRRVILETQFRAIVKAYRPTKQRMKFNRARKGWR